MAKPKSRKKTERTINIKINKTAIEFLEEIGFDVPKNVEKYLYEMACNIAQECFNEDERLP